MTSSSMIEILPVDLLAQNRVLVEELKQFASSLKLEFGWHYLLDITWILTQLGPVQSQRIMDAGAGIGVLQWYLARRGAEVISVDRTSRADLALRFRNRFRVQGLREEDLLSTTQTIRAHLAEQANNPLHRRIANQARDLLGLFRSPDGAGRVFIYNQDLGNLVNIQDNSLEAVVAVSALEHNTPEGLKQVVREIMRVLKPGGVLLATLCAAPEKDWFHEPSSGWCYTDTTLRSLFDLPPDAPSNYAQHDELLEALRNNVELRDGLAKFYFQSDKNGMPWGVWDPQYQPVGVRKVKKV